MGFSRHEWPLMCCICFRGLTEDTCAMDPEGVKWDCCRGQCGADAGIYPQSNKYPCFNCGDCHDCAFCDPDFESFYYPEGSE